MQQLARKISEAEGLQKPLAWQTVQQWERGDSAPARRRMALVLRLLEIDGAAPQVSEPPAPYGAVPPEYRQLLEDLNVLAQSRRSAFLDQIHQAAEEAREIREQTLREAHPPGKVAAARRPPTTRRTATTTVTWGDGNRHQGSLPLLVPSRDPFTAAPSDREAKFYERVERAPKADAGERV